MQRRCPNKFHPRPDEQPRLISQKTSGRGPLNKTSAPPVKFPTGDGKETTGDGAVLQNDRIGAMALPEPIHHRNMQFTSNKYPAYFKLKSSRPADIHMHTVFFIFPVKMFFRL